MVSLSIPVFFLLGGEGVVANMGWPGESELALGEEPPFPGGRSDVVVESFRVAIATRVRSSWKNMKARK